MVAELFCLHLVALGGDGMKEATVGPRVEVDPRTGLSGLTGTDARHNSYQIRSRGPSKDIDAGERL